MGSLLSPIAANIVMEDRKKKCIYSIPFQVSFHFRYLHNILIAVPINEIDTVKKTFNSFNHKIQFKIEESEKKSVFLMFLLLG